MLRTPKVMQAVDAPVNERAPPGRRFCHEHGGAIRTRGSAHVVRSPEAPGPGRSSVPHRGGSTTTPVCTAERTVPSPPARCPASAASMAAAGSSNEAMTTPSPTSSEGSDVPPVAVIARSSGCRARGDRPPQAGTSAWRSAGRAHGPRPRSRQPPGAVTVRSHGPIFVRHAPLKTIWAVGGHAPDGRVA